MQPQPETAVWGQQVNNRCTINANARKILTFRAFFLLNCFVAENFCLIAYVVHRFHMPLHDCLEQVAAPKLF